MRNTTSFYMAPLTKLLIFNSTAQSYKKRKNIYRLIGRNESSTELELELKLKQKRRKNWNRF